MLDDRARLLLHTLVERYIAEGQPVGSRTLSKASGLELSAATIRNVMADLEDLGLITSPHTSAGRVPTSRGYRLFVDTMLTADPSLRQEAGAEADGLAQMAREQLQPDQPQRVIANAAQVLSSLSSFVGVVLAPRQRSVFKHIEFLRLSDRRLLVIIVSPEGDVQNRIIFSDYPYTPSQLVEAANYLNEHFAGQDLEAVRSRLQREVEALQGEIATLMQAAVNLGSEAMSRPDDTVIVSGERNLLGVQDFSGNLGSLRRLFDVFEQKAQLIRLLDVSHKADGVRIYIGGESDLVPAQELSVVSAPYEVDGKIVGTLGVVGPTRMPYERMIRIVDVTAKMVGNALSQR